MIRLTRLDKQELALNCDLIEAVDARPDTTIRLVTAQYLVVRESVDEVLERILAWRAGILARAGLGALAAHASSPTLLPPLADTLETDMLEEGPEELAA